MIKPRNKIRKGKAQCEKCGEWIRVHGIYMFKGVYICRMCSPNKMPMTYKKVLSEKMVTKKDTSISNGTKKRKGL
jgi:late competence protein required for DNA uptake (superfamily II DNA/RNA helicase)